MKIIFYSNEKVVLEKDINKDLSVRISTTNQSLIFKVRNEIFETLGRIFKLEEVTSINKIVLGNETYNNLKYKNHDFYIHSVSDENKTSVVEDLNISFEKEV